MKTQVLASLFLTGLIGGLSTSLWPHSVEAVSELLGATGYLGL